MAPLLRSHHWTHSPNQGRNVKALRTLGWARSTATLKVHAGVDVRMCSGWGRCAPSRPARAGASAPRVDNVDTCRRVNIMQAAPRSADRVAPLWDPAFERDSCGVGLVVDIAGRPSRQIVERALAGLVNLTHRGGVGADSRTGDGAGVLTQVPLALFG